jgi:hypothetical protein
VCGDARRHGKRHRRGHAAEEEVFDEGGCVSARHVVARARHGEQRPCSRFRTKEEACNGAKGFTAVRRGSGKGEDVGTPEYVHGKRCAQVKVLVGSVRRCSAALGKGVGAGEAVREHFEAVQAAEGLDRPLPEAETRRSESDRLREPHA